MITAEVNTTRLNLLMSQFAKESKKGLNEVVEQQSGIIVGHLIAMTPPGKWKGQNLTDRGGIATSAKKLGEATIKADIASLFPTTRLKPEKVKGMIESGYKWGTGRGAKKIPNYAESVADLQRYHARSRSKATGRIKTGSTGQNMAMTRAAIRSEFMRMQVKRVGILNAGWLRAGKRLKTAKRAMPAWITRHGDKPGDVVFRETEHGLSIVVANRMDYFPRNIEGRIQRAVYRRAAGLEKALEAMLKRKADKINRRMKATS